MAPGSFLRGGIAVLSLAALFAGCHHSAPPAPAPAARPSPRGLPAEGGLYLPRGASREKVMIECGDGYRMAGEYIKRERSVRLMPGVIFLHDYGSNRDKWYPLNYLTGARGYAVLSLDLRGHGESPSLAGNPATLHDKLAPEDFQKMVQDVRNAVSHLAMKRGVAGNRIAIAGMGLGANVALLAAAEPWAVSVSCLVLVSPAMNYHGLDISEAAGKIKDKRVYIAVGRQDEPSYAAAMELKRLVKGPVEMLEDESDAHGVAMMGKGVLAKMPNWLNESLMAPLIAEENRNIERKQAR